MKKVYLVITIIIIVLALTAFFYPKNAGGGTCGFCQAGQYKWIEYNCLGFTKIGFHGSNFMENIFGTGFCLDCPKTRMCYGLVYGTKKCYDKSDEPRTEISCD